MMTLNPRLHGAILKTGLQLFGRFAKVFHQVWHEVIGTLFVVLGLAAIPSTIRVWRTGDARMRAILATIFIALMFYYGVTSFLHARRVGRRKA